MVAPHTILRSVKEAIQSSNAMPSETTYATFELDSDGYQSDVRPPVVEITMDQADRLTSLNTDFTNFAYDNNGNEIGKIFRASFEMPVQIDVWTAENGGFDHRTLGYDIQRALRQYESRQRGDRLPDPDDSGALSNVARIELQGGQTTNDLTMTPALRRWRQRATITFDDVINTADEYGANPYIDTVITPSDGDWESGDPIEIVYDATPNEDSDADDYT